MGRLIDADVLLSEMEKYSDDSARSKNEYLFGMQQREANDFCSYGERKDGDHHEP